MSTPKEIGVAEQMPGASGFTMVVFKSSDVPVGTKLYKTPQPLEDTPVAWVDEKAEVLKFGGWDRQPFAKSFKPVFYKANK